MLSFVPPTSNVEHLVCSLAMCVSSLEKCLWESFVLFGGCWVSNPAAHERRLAVCLPRTSWSCQPALAVSQVLFISAAGHEAGALRAAGLSLRGLCISCVHGQAVGLGWGSARAGTPARATQSLLPSSWGGVLGRVHGVGTGWPGPGLGKGDGGLQALRGGP